VDEVAGAHPQKCTRSCAFDKSLSSKIDDGMKAGFIKLRQAAAERSFSISGLIFSASIWHSSRCRDIAALFGNKSRTSLSTH
jgi:hypothetical protein